MPVEFLNRLSEEQIIDLINYVNSKNEFASSVKQIQVFRELDRCDEFGNQEILVNAWNGNFHVGMYIVQDFCIREPFNKKINEMQLREYLTSIFGEEYLNALRDFYAIKAEKEIERIKSTLGIGRS